MVEADDLHRSTNPQTVCPLVSLSLFPSRDRRDDISRLDLREDLKYFDFDYDVVTCILELFHLFDCVCIFETFSCAFTTYRCDRRWKTAPSLANPVCVRFFLVRV